MQTEKGARCPSPLDAGLRAREGELARKLKACSVIAYSEATLLRIPFTGVYAPKESGVTAVSLEPADTLFSGPKRRWTVRSAGLTLPGNYARKVFRALEWMAIDESVVHGRPFANPLQVSPRDICERLCWHPHQGQLDAIGEALHGLAKIEIVPDSAPRGARSPARSSHGIKLLSVVAGGIYKGAAGKFGFSSFKVSFDPRFVESVNRGNVVALNWAVWSALDGPLAQRLMELLESESVRHPDSSVIALDRKALYRLIPMSTARSLKERQALLDQAHRELIKVEYVESVGSSATADLLLYQPGIAWHSLRLQNRPKPAVDTIQRMMDGRRNPKSAASAPQSPISGPAARMA